MTFNIMFIYYLLFTCKISKVLAIPVISNEINTNNIDEYNSKTENDAETDLTNEQILKQNVPQYMASLYRKISKQKNTDKSLMHYGNVVRSYFDKGSVIDKEILHCYIFNISDIEKEKEILTYAELHLYKRPQKKSSMTLLQINVQDIDSGQIVSSRILSSQAHGWIVFPVKNIINNWISDKKKNKGVYITVQTLYGKNKRVKFATTKNRRREPILVAYTKGSNDMLLASLINLNSEEIVKNNTEYKNQNPEPEQVLNRFRRKVPNFRPCRLEALNVPLRRIGWDKNFMSPSVFKINQCKGKCWHDASKAYNKQTNHAIVQALYATVTDGSKASYPCCAPTSFESVTALMADASTGLKAIKIVSLEKLKVTSCECL